MKLQFVLLSMGILLTLSQNTNATDVCASENIGAQVTADKICPDNCKKAGATSWGGIWLGKSSMKCTEKAPENTAGSICGCTFTGCTDVNISYSYNSANPANWTADVYYTPCGATKEAAFPYYARKWTDNHLSVARGTRVRIGPEGTASNYVDETVTGDHLYVQCGGTMAQGKERSHCEVVITPPPIQKCTEVTASFLPGKDWGGAHIWFTPCNAVPPAHEPGGEDVFYPWKSTAENTVSIKSGTTVSMSPFGRPYCIENVPMSGAKVTIELSFDAKGNRVCKIK